jgi:beta-galactosidase GanA
LVFGQRSERSKSAGSVLTTLLAIGLFQSALAAPPMLREQGSATQLIVDGKPFLILGGELANSSASSLEYMKPLWSRFTQQNLNTVLVTVSWELIEPREGAFDFSSVDGLIREARNHDLKLVLLWFGSWKNSMSSYVPAWVKRDQARFPRAQLPNGQGMEILSPLSAANRDADAKAFRALMAHLKEFDGVRNTVIMIQVENEVGMLPVAREYGAEADRLFNGPVPTELAKTPGNWVEVFGRGAATEEIFTAWSLARYVDAVAAAGKSVYPLPMYVNAALNRPEKLPGEYPSGGPLPHLIDVWKAGAPSIDFLSPDIYFPNFVELVGKYHRPKNPLFIPEANRAGMPEGPANAFFAIGRYEAIGFSPFSIDSMSDKEAERLTQGYKVLREIAPTLLANQGSGRTYGFRPTVAYDGTLDDSPQTFTLGGFEFNVSFVDRWTPREQQQTVGHGGLIVQVGPEEFFVAGSGFSLGFKPLGEGPPIAGIDSAWEGRFVEGKWSPGRLLNGDETHQGRLLKMPRERFGIQRLKLYRYH